MTKNPGDYVCPACGVMGWHVCTNGNFAIWASPPATKTAQSVRRKTIQEIIDWIEGGKIMSTNRRNFRGMRIATELKKMLEEE